MHSAAIAAHAVSGLVSFIAGCVLLSRTPDRARQAGWLAAFGAGLLGMILYMAAALFAHWDRLSTAQQSVYLGLFGLGIYMAGRAWDGWQAWRDAPARWAERFADDIGFNVIGLFDGFVIVTAIDLGAPVWLVAVAAAVPIVAGNRLVTRVKRRVANA